MQKWEYMVKDLGIWVSSCEYRLESIGDDGWELVGIYKEDGSWYAVFKRPK